MKRNHSAEITNYDPVGYFDVEILRYIFTLAVASEDIKEVVRHFQTLSCVSYQWTSLEFSSRGFFCV